MPAEYYIARINELEAQLMVKEMELKEVQRTLNEVCSEKWPDHLGVR